MAKGLEKHQGREQALSLFGKNLARRSGSKCELCSASGVKLSIYEIPPVPTEPDYALCAFFCETCISQIEKPKKIDANHWRCLNHSAWSEEPSTQVMAIRILQKLSETQDWARELLVEVYVDDAVQLWADKSKL